MIHFGDEHPHTVTFRPNEDDTELIVAVPLGNEVLPLIANGLLNKQAAAELGISEVTLQIHRSRIMKKMAASSFAELVRMAGQLEMALGRRKQQ